MNILYCCPFNIDLPTGKNRATRHKIVALNDIADELFVIVPKGGAKRFRGLAGLACELKCVAVILRHGKHIDCFVSRGDVGLLSVPLAMLRSIRVFREVHADPFGELALLNKPKLMKGLLKLSFHVSLWVNRMADVRIFNNPMLKDYFIKRGWGNDSDVVSYNGGSADAIAAIDQQAAAEKYALKDQCRYLAFVGSASKWHGVNLLVDLQAAFNRHDDGIQILCAGGRVTRDIDPDGLLVNITPLDDVGCAEIIQCASACLLPVESNRVSPGSPLKLYDYMVNGKPVIAQRDLPGYSDEVERYQSGVTVDFHAPEEARETIVAFLAQESIVAMYSNNAKQALPDYCWAARVKSWFADGQPVLSE